MRTPLLASLSAGFLALLAACGGDALAPKASAEGAAPATAEEDTAALLPEGAYACTQWSGGMLMNFGKIEIEGSRYRGPGYDGKFPGGWHSYDLSPEGAVSWSGKLGALDEESSSVVSSMLTTGDAGQTFIRVLVMTGSGSTQTIDCRLGG